MTTAPQLGATPREDGSVEFLLWAPAAPQVSVHVVAPSERLEVMEAVGRGYHHAVIPDVRPGARYRFALAPDKERPDPASRSQPDGVHESSEVVEVQNLVWKDQAWCGLPLSQYVIYELHVGTFTQSGTFDGAIERLDELAELGVTAVELMPIAQFPGGRNWGYDGVYPYAPQNTYGGISGLQRLVNACHQRGLAVVLDVVYNHLGPEGNYLRDFAPYFTDRYRTPWGSALNYDGPSSDEVRRYFIENALYWLRDLHIDALRLDAIHEIHDESAFPFLEELAVVVHREGERLNRRLSLIAESDLNDARIIRSRSIGGYGLDAQWSDDLHHAVHAVVTGERQGYYVDFGGLEPVARVLRESFLYQGEFSEGRGRRHGNSPGLNQADQFVICIQNHDQVGNRMMGNRLSSIVGLEQAKLAAGTVLLSPFIPLLFMGEEYGELQPFQYFTSHGDPDLVEAVRQGRMQEFAAFAWEGTVPDPHDEQTFLNSRVRPDVRHVGTQRQLRELYRHLIALRKRWGGNVEQRLNATETQYLPEHEVVWMRRRTESAEVLVVYNFSAQLQHPVIHMGAAQWSCEVDSASDCWGGPGMTNSAELTTSGATRIDVAPHAFVAWRKDLP
jgi:maltooligosyltrehalose trehalohydrolase